MAAALAHGQGRWRQGKRAREQPRADEEQRGTPPVRRLASGEPTAKPREVEAPEASRQGFLDRKPPYVKDDEWKNMNRT